GRRCLQFKVKGAAEALAQRQTPGPVDPAAVGRMDNQLGATGLVEETLHDQPLLGRQRAQRRTGAREILDDLASSGVRQAERAGKPVDCSLQSRRPIRSIGAFRPHWSELARERRYLGSVGFASKLAPTG